LSVGCNEVAKHGFSLRSGGILSAAELFSTEHPYYLSIAAKDAVPCPAACLTDRTALRNCPPHSVYDDATHARCAYRIVSGAALA
jgi:hypothetical protein